MGGDPLKNVHLLRLPGPLRYGTSALGYVRENARRMVRTTGTVEKRSSCGLCGANEVTGVNVASVHDPGQAGACAIPGEVHTVTTTL